jgi:hypothetical protein
MSAELDEDVIVEWWRRSRAAQGLPERIVDAGVLARVVTLALSPAPEGNGHGGNGTAPSRGQGRGGGP